MAVKLLIYLIAGLGAGVGTGLAGLSAAAVISPMLITFLNVPAYEAVAIALASDVLASAISAYTYGKHKNLDIKNGLNYALLRVNIHIGRQLYRLPRAKQHNGRLFRFYDDIARR